MIASLAARLVALGMPARYSRAAVIAIGAVALVLAALLAWNFWLGSHDKRVIAGHDAAANAEVAEKVGAANEAANEQAREDDARAAAESAELRRMLENDVGPSTHPSEQRLAILRCVRLQQAARAAGDPVPACH